MLNRFAIFTCLMIFAAGCQNSASVSPGLAPTTQQSLTSAQTSLNAMKFTFGLVSGYVNSQISDGKIKNAAEVAAIQAAETQFQTDLTQWQTDINTQNLTGLAFDKQNVLATLETIAAQAGGAALSELLGS